MSELYDFKELVKRSGLPERTVRYYLANVVNAPDGTRGRKTFYSQETLDQLMLAKKVLMQEYDHKRGEVKPSLMDFKNWKDTLSVGDIRRMANTQNHIHPKSMQPANIQAPKLNIADNLSPVYSQPDTSASWNSSEEVKEQTNENAAQYLNRVMGSTPKPVARKEWQSFRFGNDLVIKTRERLTPEQKDQLELAGKLLQSVLKERK